MLGDLFTKKFRKRQILEYNKYRGRLAEHRAVMDYSIRGYEVERTGRGSDFKVKKRDPWTGKVISSKLVEVKSSPTAPLSKLQKKTRRKKKGRYEVVRYDSWF